MLNIQTIYDVFNSNSLLELSKKWREVMFDMRILCPFNLRKLFELDNFMKEVFIPVCSTCLLNARVNEGLSPNASYDDMLIENGFGNDSMFLVCKHCVNKPKFHKNLIGLVDPLFIRRKIFACDVLEFHILCLAQFNLMSVGEVKDWEFESQRIIDALKCTILTEEPFRPSESVLSHTYEDLGGDNVTVHLRVGDEELSYDPTYLLKNNSVTKIQEIDDVKFPLSFDSPCGKSFVIPMDSLLRGVGLESNTSDSDLKQKMANHYLFPFGWRFELKFLKYFNTKLRPYGPEDFKVSVHYNDPVMGISFPLQFSFFLNDGASYIKHLDIHFDDRTLYRNFTAYNDAIYSLGMRDYLVIDVLYTRKSCLLDLEIKSCSQFLMLSKKRCDGSASIPVDLSEEEKSSFVKLIYDFKPSKLGREFIYYSYGSAARIVRFDDFYRNTTLRRKLFMASNTIYSRYVKWDVDKKSIRYRLDTEKDGQDATIERFHCYRCFYHKHVNKYKVSLLSCTCWDTFSYGSRIIRETGLNKPIDGIYYNWLASSSLLLPDIKIRVGGFTSILSEGKCQGCGDKDVLLYDVIYSNLKHCARCLSRYVGLTARMYKFAKKTDGLLTRYGSYGNWKCERCLTYFDEDDDKFMSRCLHTIMCSLCFETSLNCDSCLQAGVIYASN